MADTLCRDLRLVSSRGWPGSRLTVALSILLHGITAYPGSNAYADWYQRQHEDHHKMIESKDVAEVRQRRRISRP
jgi:hypothetical protein